MRKVCICLLVSISCIVLAYKVLRPHSSCQGVLHPIIGKALSGTAWVSTKQIIIPGYSRAFIPSLIPYKEGYLLSFRIKPKASKVTTKNLPKCLSSLGVTLLDKKFKVKKKSVQLLDIISYSSEISSTAEDGRLFIINNRIYFFFNDLLPSQKQGGQALYVAELIEDQGRFVLKEPAKLLNYSRANSMEKNWSPFLSNNKLYVIYSDQPRVILEVDLSTGNCEEVVRTDSKLNWSWGEIRGGSPAYFVNDTLLTFFHSDLPLPAFKNGSHEYKLRNYVMGAYTFDKDPPFAIRTITPLPLGQLDDYNKNNRRKIIFPAGAVIEEKFIHVTWGKNDNQIFVTSFDKELLLNSMVPRQKLE